MNRNTLIQFALAMACMCLVTASQWGETRESGIQLQEPLSEARPQTNSYEKSNGKPSAERMRHDFRELRTQLIKKEMSEVMALIGSPAQVFSTGANEAWDYMNIAY